MEPDKMDSHAWKVPQDFGCVGRAQTPKDKASSVKARAAVTWEEYSPAREFVPQRGVLA